MPYIHTYLSRCPTHMQFASMHQSRARSIHFFQEIPHRSYDIWQQCHWIPGAPLENPPVRRTSSRLLPRRAFSTGPAWQRYCSEMPPNPGGRQLNCAHRSTGSTIRASVELHRGTRCRRSGDIGRNHYRLERKGGWNVGSTYLPYYCDWGWYSSGSCGFGSRIALGGYRETFLKPSGQQALQKVH